MSREPSVGSYHSVCCPLCLARDHQILDTVSYESLRRVYLKSAQFDIETCLHQPYQSAVLQLTRCQSCGLEFYPIELQGDETLYEHFGKADYYYMADKWEFREALNWIKDSRSVLEVGCGTGVFLDMVRECFPEKKLIGLEYNQTASTIARNKGFDVRAQSIEELASAAEQFDAVCAFQVLEHVPNPDSFLKAIFGCLRERGVCILTVPNPDCFTKFAVNDFGNMPPHHLTRWSRNVMRWVANHHGLEIASLAEEPVATYHREWYRRTHLVRVLSAVMGIRWGRIEPGFGHKVFYFLCRVIDRAVPKSLWRYDRFPGHTLFAAFKAN